MGLYGVLVVTEPASAARRTYQAYGTTFDTDVALLLSEIDPVQNPAVDTGRAAPPASATRWCGTASPASAATYRRTVHTCYPPAVNYSPLYYLVNGVSFDRTNRGRVCR